MINSWTEDYGDDTFMDFDMTKLGTDQAYVHITNNNQKSVSLFSLVKKCIKCPYTNEIEAIGTNTTEIFNTRYEKLYRFYSHSDTPNLICDIDTNFGQFGVYSIQVNSDDCAVDVLKEPVNIYFSMLTVFLIYSALLLVPILAFFHKRYKRNSNPDAASGGDSLAKAKQKERLRSLDTFRGISIVVMIFVNYGAGGYEVLEHATWNGLQLADLVFPWFMWIMGVCIPISVKSVQRRKVPLKDAIINVFRRSCILFALGLFLGASANLNKLRVFGVLQRFGICYFVVATMCLLMMKQQHEDEDQSAKTLKNMFRDVVQIKFLWVVTLVILAIHCLIVFLLPVPDCPTGYLGPGGNHEGGTNRLCTGGATGYIDRLILGNHAYRYPTIVDMYKSQAFDPEGILGCLTSIVQVFIGAQAGYTLITFKSHRSRIIRWLCWATLTGLIGGALCGFSKEDGVIPVNKNLWSLSFVLVTSSFAFILLSFCYVLIDVKRYWSGTPFIYAGMNAIIMYVGHSMTGGNFPIHWYVENNNTHFLKFTAHVWATMMWILAAMYLYHKKIFFSI